jgi:hypothetical protein
MVITIFNATDGISATYRTFRKIETAKKWIDNKRHSFKTIQGYYLTSRRERIEPNDINYIIINNTSGERISY